MGSQSGETAGDTETNATSVTKETQTKSKASVITWSMNHSSIDSPLLLRDDPQGSEEVLVEDGSSTGSVDGYS